MVGRAIRTYLYENVESPRNIPTPTWRCKKINPQAGFNNTQHDTLVPSPPGSRRARPRGEAISINARQRCVAARFTFEIGQTCQNNIIILYVPVMCVCANLSTFFTEVKILDKKKSQSSRVGQPTATTVEEITIFFFY